MENKTITELLQERDERMLNYRYKVAEGFEGGYPKEWDEEIIAAFTIEVEEVMRELEGMRIECEWCKKVVDEDCQHYDEKANVALTHSLTLLDQLKTKLK
jgi:hypothetical protein